MIDASWYKKPAHIKERIAAGGIIVRIDEGQLLIGLIKEAKFPMDYSLPKGGVEKGEAIEQAARREIAEEAGITELEAMCYLGKQERLSFSKRSWAVIHYYLFKTTQKTGRPTDIKNYSLEWFPLDKLPQIFWPEQKTFIEQNMEKIRQLIIV